MIIDAVPPEKRLDYLNQQVNPKRQVKLKTCADVYNRWRSCKRLYKKAPKDGVEFQVDYIDTGLALDESIRAQAPIALALHGAPGSYHDFALLIHHLTQQNVRVIAPNFPEYTATVKTKRVFRHSADEKAAYLRDFLKAIGVSKIDLLVSHSSAIFPTLLILLNANREAIARKERQKQEQQQEQLQQGRRQNKQQDKQQANNNINVNKNNNSNSNNNSADDTVKVVVEFDEPIEIRALALFNPAGHRLPKSMKPTWWKCGSVHIYQHKIGRYWFRKLGPACLTVIGVPVRVDNMDNVMLSATVMRNSKCHRVLRQLQQLSQMKVPTLLVFSENDKLIEKEIFYEMTQFMNLDPKNFDILNNDGDIELSRKYFRVFPTSLVWSFYHYPSSIRRKNWTNNNHLSL